MMTEAKTDERERESLHAIYGNISMREKSADCLVFTRRTSFP